MHAKHTLTALVALAACAAAHAEVPLRWTVETSRAQTATFDAYHGETLSLEASLNAYGKPFDMASKTCSIFWQTNGMGEAWWIGSASANSNRVTASFTPQMDPGASAVYGFLGSSGDVYRAAFAIRFRSGPGAVPNAMATPPRILDLASTVVVNPPWPTTNDFAAATNDMAGALKAYVDAEIEGAGAVTPQIVTNIVDGKIAEIPQGGVSTNAVSGIVTNHVTSGYLCTVAAADAKYLPLTGGTLTGETPTLYFANIDLAITRTVLDKEYLHFYAPDFLFMSSGSPSERSTLTPDDSPVATSNMVNGIVSGTSLTNGGAKAYADAAVANAGHMTQSAADAAYYPKASGDAWSSYWDGDDVRVTVTNYDSSVNLPSLYLEQRTNETAQATNAFKTVWREMAHWDTFLGTNWNWRTAWSGFHAWRTNVEAEVDAKADRAWGYYNSHTGTYSPDGYTQISSSNVMIAAGMSYQKTVTTSAEVWVLTANEPYEPTGVSTNGGFQIRDADGNVQFEIVKGDKVTAAAQANAVTVDTTTTPQTLVVTYNIVASSHPTAEVCLDLATANWKAETAADCPATVTWTGESGAYVARIRPTAETDRCFVKATYQRGGDTYINNRCAVGMSQIVLGGVTYDLGTNTISGKLVLTLTPAN